MAGYLPIYFTNKIKGEEALAPLALMASPIDAKQLVELKVVATTTKDPAGNKLKLKYFIGQYLKTNYLTFPEE